MRTLAIALLLVTVSLAFTPYLSTHGLYGFLASAPLCNHETRSTRFESGVVYSYGQKAESDLRLRIAFVGNVHARELVTGDAAAAAAFDLLNRDSYFCRHTREHVPAIHLDIMIVPVATEAGRDAVVFTDNKCLRTTPDGIDLNRNWPLPDPPAELRGCDAWWPTRGEQQWHRTLMKANNPNLDAETYGGQALAPENERLMRLFREFRPDIVIAVHSGAQLLMVPFDSSPCMHPHMHEHLMVAKVMSISANWTNVGPGMRTLYIANGTMCDYLSMSTELNMPICITAEIYNDLASSSCFHFFNPPANITDPAYRRTMQNWIAACMDLMRFAYQKADVLRQFLPWRF